MGLLTKVGGRQEENSWGKKISNLEKREAWGCPNTHVCLVREWLRQEECGRLSPWTTEDSLWGVCVD